MNNEKLPQLTSTVPLQATIWIWSLSIPLFLLCIPILTLTETGILLPLLVLISVVTGTASIWFFYGKSNHRIDFEVKQLQTRIEDLETIAGYDKLERNF